MKDDHNIYSFYFKHLVHTRVYVIYMDSSILNLKNGSNPEKTSEKYVKKKREVQLFRPI